MKQKINILLVAVLLMTNTLNVNAQETAYEKANILYNQLQYSQAIPELKIAFEKEKNEAKKSEILFKIGECYRNTNNSSNAVTYYNKALNAKYQDPILRLYLAEQLKMLKKYDAAIKEYEKYMALAPEDPRGQLGIESCNLAKDWIANPTKTQVKSLVQANSKLDDFAPAISKLDNGDLLLYIGTSRPGVMGTDKDAWTGQNFSDIFSGTRNKSGKWTKFEALPSTINTQANEGALTFNKEGNRMFFTRCSVVKKQNSFCKIYVSEKNGETWGEAVVLPLAPDSFSVGQPALSPDGKSLYFSSDMTGGKGGKDIWVSTSEDGKTFSEPVNVETVNTPWDEKWPYIKDDGTLFFSSQGHTSIGGLDIFMLKDSAVINMKTPINSTSDDFGIAFEDSTKGFLTSNRESSGGYDIYFFIDTDGTFVANPSDTLAVNGSNVGNIRLMAATGPTNISLTISGTVTDTQTGNPVSGAKVTVTGDDGTSFSTVTDAIGNYTTAINSGELDASGKMITTDGTNYEILMESPNYFKARTRETTIGLKGIITKKIDFVLDPALAKNVEIQLPYIEYDFNSVNLRPESKVALNKLIKTMNDNPTIKIELQSHTDSRGSEIYNMKLSQGRAQSVVDYLIENGIKGERLIAKGYGKTKLKISDDIVKRLPTDEKKEEAHQVNRRTAFSVISYDYTSKRK